MAANDTLGLNVEFPIYVDQNNVKTRFHNLVLHKSTVESVVMSLGDKVTGDVYYKDNELDVSMQEYIEVDGVRYILVNPPTIVREGMVSDNSQPKGMTKYSFVFYHPMCQLGNFPFADVAVSADETKYLSENKTFSWIGHLPDYVAKLNKNLEGTQWVVTISPSVPQETLTKLSEVLPFDKNTIADALKTGYDTWEVPYIIDSVATTESYYSQGKRFKVIFGLPSNEIYENDSQRQLNNPFVFQFGQGVGLKNNSRTPRNNKIITRITGSGSERNIPYGYPQIPWYGDMSASFTYGNAAGVYTNVTIGGRTFPKVVSYPIYEGIVGGRYVKLIKHPFTRTTLMPSVYSQAVFNKVSPYIQNTTQTEGSQPIYDQEFNELLLIIDGHIANCEDNTEKAAFTALKNALWDIVDEDSSGGTISRTIHGSGYDITIRMNADRVVDGVLTWNAESDNGVKEFEFAASATIVGYATPNPDYDPDATLIDYYDAITSEQYPYPNPIVPTAPSYENHQFEDIYPELGQNISLIDAYPINDSDLQRADAWDDTIDDDGNYKQGYFKVKLPVLSFDLYACAAITEEMQINMRSGACLGCTFTVQVDWEDYKNNFYDTDGSFVPYGTQRDLNKYPNSSTTQIELILQKDTQTFGTLMPNVYQNPKGETSQGAGNGDTFVVLGISLPLSYITNAEQRLDDEMKSYMLENNVHYFDYPLKFDEFFLRNNRNILSQIKPNTVIRFKYGQENLQLFVKQLVVKYGDKPLPQYDITLTDNVEVVLNSIGQVADDVEKLSSLISILRQSYSRNVWNELAKKLSKTQDDTAQGFIRFLKGLQVGQQFVTGLLGEGGVFRKEADGTTYLEADKMYIRMKAYFDSVEIREYQHSAGNRVASVAGNKCVRVAWFNSSNVELEQTQANLASVAYFRCYFRASDGEDTVRNNFVIGDQVYCHITSVNGSTDNPNEKGLNQKHYWRLCIGRNVEETLTDDGEAWIDVSNRSSETLTISGTSYTHAGYQTGSDIPEPQDSMIQLGNINDVARQGAIIEFVTGANAPSYQIYQGINDFSLNNKNQVALGYDTSTGRAYMNVFGDFRFGSANDDGSFIKYNAGSGQLDIKAKINAQSTIGSQSLPDYIKDNQNNYNDAWVHTAVEDLQSQIDGEIDSWFYNYLPVASIDSKVPLTNREPYKTWYEADGGGTASEETTERTKHLGDTFYDNSSGYAFRFSLNETTNAFEWVIITDSAVVQALANAAKAQETADGKRATFSTWNAWVKNGVNTLKQGDLFIPTTDTTQGGTTYKAKKVYKCTTDATNAFEEVAYTDDSAFNGYINAIINGSGSSGDAAVAAAAQRAITSALGGGTVVDGGLLLTSLIAMRKYNSTTQQYTTWAGISGTYQDSETGTGYKGHGIAAWYGGAMVDKEVSTSATDYAKSLFRFDGSGYLAGGNITWDKNGIVTIANVYADVSGTNVSLSGSLQTLAALSNALPLRLESSVTYIDPQYSFWNLSVKGKTVATQEWVGQNYLSIAYFNHLFQAYSNADHADAHKILPNDVQTTVNNLKILVGTWTDQYLSALGLNPDSSGGGGGAMNLSDLVDVVLSSPTTGQALIYDGHNWVNGNVTTGTVTSVGMSVPTGFSVSGSPITTSGTLAISFASGYSLPTTAKQGNWDAAYGWGNHASAGYWKNGTGNHPTTLSDYGITDAKFGTASVGKRPITLGSTTQDVLIAHQTLYTLSIYGGDTKVLDFKPNANASIYINAGGDISLTNDTTNKYITLSYSHPTATATRIDEATGKVLSAITVNNLGHVTSVSAKTLAAADIPTLSISKINGLQAALNSKLDIAFFSALFKAYAGTTEVTPNNSTSSVDNIKAMFGFWTEQYISALGKNSSSSGGGGGATNLDDLVDVTITSPQENDLLIRGSGGQWINTSKSSFLSGYATQSWVQSQGYLTSLYSLTLKSKQGNTTSTVTTFSPTSAAAELTLVAGTNITIAPNATNHTIEIVNSYSLPTASSDAKGGVMVGSTLAIASAVLNLKSGIATAGTAGQSTASSGYTLSVPYVTVDTYGRVTGYGTHTHTVSSIPNSSLSNSSITVNGTSISLGSSGTTSKWGTARTVTIKDNDETNSCANASIDGSANFTLKLPSTIKATLTGNASSATKLASSVSLWGNSFDGSADIANSIYLPNGKYIYWKDSGGTNMAVIGVNALNSLVIGYSTAGAEKDTHIHGKNIWFYYSKDHTTGIYLNSSGNVGIGLTNQSYKLDVSGTFRASGNSVVGGTLGVTGATTLSSTLSVTSNATIGDTLGVSGLLTANGDISIPYNASTHATPYIKIGEIYIGYNSENNALEVYKLSGSTHVAANFYATGGVSALGYGDSGSGGGTDMNTVWSALGNYDSVSSHFIDYRYIGVKNAGVTLDWNTAKTIATIGSNGSTIGITVKLPANPNTDTKNTAGGDNSTNKLFLVGIETQQTTNNGTARTYTNSNVYATNGALHASTYNALTLTAAATGFTIAGGTTSKTLTVGESYTLGAACAKGVVTSIDTSASLPTSNAVKTFVEGKGYTTNTGTVTSITLKAGTGISLDVDNTAITTSGTRTITNTGVRAVSINGDYLRVNTNGTNADLTIPYAGYTNILRSVNMASGDDYDTLSGYSYARGCFVALNFNNFTTSDVTLDDLGLYDTLVSFGYGNRTIQFKGAAYNDALKYRHVRTVPNSNPTQYDLCPWKTIAFTDSNVASATKLQTSRTIWGRPFDGTANVTGSLQDVDEVRHNNNTAVSFKDTVGTVRTALSFNDSNQFNIAYGMAAAGYDTYINGYNIYLEYGDGHSHGLILNSSGNVGIGTVSPAYKLDVNGTMHVGTTSYLQGNVGISTAPDTGTTYKLKVGGRMSVDGDIYLTGTSKEVNFDGSFISGYEDGSDNALELNTTKLLLTADLTTVTGNLVVGDNVGDGSYIQIGDIRIGYDSKNNALKVYKVSNGSVVAANFYATGGVSALGASTITGGGGGGIDETQMWSVLARNTSEQINASHLSTALGSYVTTNTTQNVTASKQFAAGLSTKSINIGTSRRWSIYSSDENLSSETLNLQSTVDSKYFCILDNKNEVLMRVSSGTTSTDGLIVFQKAPWVKASTGNYPIIKYYCGDTQYGHLGFSAAGTAAMYNPTNTTWYTLLHAGNYSSYALPLSGGTLTSANHQVLQIDSIATSDGNGLWTGIQFSHTLSGTSTFYGGIYMKEQNGSFYRYDSNYTAKKMWDEGNDGNGSGLDADLLDGQHGSYYATASSVTTLQGYFTSGIAKDAMGLYPIEMASGDDYDTYSNYTRAKGCFVAVNNNNLTSSDVTLDDIGNYTILASFGYKLRTMQIKGATYEDTLKYRRINKVSSGVFNFSAWKTFAFTDSNVASATKLQTSRTLWGNIFNGTADIANHLYLPNNKYIYCYNNPASGDAASYIVLGLNTNNDMLIGYGTAGAGYNTLVYGNHISFCYGTSRTEAIRLTNGGNVGIGTASPSYKLHVAGTGYFSNTLTLANNISLTLVDTNSVAKRAVFLDTDNNFVLGYDMRSSNNAVMYGNNIHFRIGDNNRLTVTNAFVRSTVGFYSDSYVSALGQNTSSDIRMKDVRGNVMLRIKDIADAPSVKYLWKDRHDMGMQAGSIAQYWQRVLPETVHEGADGMLSMEYGVIALLASIATARKVRDHEERILELERENRELKEEVERLKTA